MVETYDLPHLALGVPDPERTFRFYRRDPHGYKVEIWYELPTSADPPTLPCPARARGA